MMIFIILFIIIFTCKSSEIKSEQLNSITDLTWPFDDNSIYWQSMQSFAITKRILNSSDEDWYAANNFQAGEHGGTHFDAPYHFDRYGLKVGDIPLSKLIVNGITINLKNITEDLQEKTLLLPEHLNQWVSEHGSIPPNTVTLIQFGWAQYYHNKTKYMGIKNGVYNFPGISKGAAEWIVNNGNIVGVGLDTASSDPGNSTDFIAHKILLKNNIYGLENLKIPNQFPAKDFKLFVMPMKIAEGTGAPLRIIAMPIQKLC